MRRIGCILLTCLLLVGCGGRATAPPTPTGYVAGFAAEELPVDVQKEIYYMAGYHNGVTPVGVLDSQRVNALWLEDGATALLLLSVDCVGLGSGTVEEIRQRLEPFCARTGCAEVQIVSTHTHAGVDTLGLWGPVGLDGKNPTFMERLMAAAVRTAEAAYAARTPGDLFYSKTPTEGLQKDSRPPYVYDENLYQLRFAPHDGAKPGIRVVSFAAHAEALRGDNRLISRDYPGVLSDRIKAETGDDTLFLPGAVGGLIMTPVLIEGDAVENCRVTGERLAEAALSPAAERPLSPGLKLATEKFSTPLDNTLFVYYQFLGILQNSVSRGIFGGYRVTSSVTALQIGDVTLALLPGEIFPELVAGTGDDQDPEGLAAIAARQGVTELVSIGLANDELGYVVPPSDWLLHPDYPYVQEAPEHYEETNSVGETTAHAVAEAFARALAELET